MKKWFLLLFCVFIYTLSHFEIKANANYKTFESITLTSGKLLKDYTDKEYKDYYKKVSKRKFYGWRTHEVHTDIKVKYKTETCFSYYNDGLTPIKYTYMMQKKQVDSMHISASGNIKVSLTGNVKKFKGGLNSELKVSGDFKSSSDVKEEFEIKMDIDPGTMANLYVYGEGLISNGVAANYLFWIRTKRGGYEIFYVTTQYYRLEKVTIWKRYLFL